MADGDGQHEHVHLRDFARLHPDGAHDHEEDARDHRLQGRRQHPRTR